ncbi:MAG: hypothetical protein ACON4H_06595 [Rubripirellula sp.]
MSQELDGSWIEASGGERLLICRAGVVDSQAVEAAGEDTVCSSEVTRCAAWFVQAKKVSTPSINSFWLQQFLQHWAGEPICQGAVILAASQAGYAIAREPNSRTSSVKIGVDQECISQFDCGCGHP